MIRPASRNTTGVTPPTSAQPSAQAGGEQASGRGGGRGAQALGRWHWDSPLITSAHLAGRIYYAGDRVYRSDDRGDSWIAISGDLTRQLDATTIPIMGKVWPQDSVAFNQATTTLSTITAIDESPLLDGLIYVGTDDGLIQVTEDGGENWRKVEKLTGVAEYSYVTDIFASPRDVDTVFATLNNYQRGDFKPYVVRSRDRGRTWTSIAGNLPQRSGAWSIVQDHVNGSLLFAGMEFGVWMTVDAGTTWVQLKGGIPTTQARDLHIQRRENDLIVGTFGRGTFILDDYSALRALTPQMLTELARLFPLRDAYMFDVLGQQQAAWGNVSTPNPPYGTIFTYSIGSAPEGSAKMVLNITDDAGRQVRRLALPAGTGVNRIAWDLRGEAPRTRETTDAGGGRGGGPGASSDDQEPSTPAFGGRGGPRQGPPVAPGRYRAAIGRLDGETFTPVGESQTFRVIPLPR